MSDYDGLDANPKPSDARTLSPNSDTVPPPGASPFKAASVLNKPSGRAVGRKHKSIRSYEDDLNPMPVYADDPGLWNHRMRARMHGWLQKKGIKLTANRNTIVAGAFERAHGKPDNERLHFVALYLELQKFRDMARAAREDYRRNPTALRDIALEAHVGDHFARNILGADPLKWDPDKAVALAELRSSSERAVKDGDGQPIAASVKPDWSAAIEAGKKMGNQPAVNEVHWIDVDEARKKFWRDAKGLAAAAGVMDKLQEKFIHAAAVNDENGSLHDYKGTPDEALTLVLRAALRRQLELAYEPGEITTNLIRRILSGPFETALTVLGHMGVLQRIKEHIEKELDGQSGKAEITILDIPKPPATPANDVKPPEPTKPVVSLAGEAAQTVSVNSGLPTIQPIIYGESPCTVYPMDRGSVIYKGIKFSVTLRKPGGTWAMAVELMEEFVAHKELIDASCLAQPVAASNVMPFAQPAVATLPMAVGQSAPVPAPMTPVAGAMDSKGRVPGQTGADAITGVKKVVDDGKTTIELWAKGSFAEHRLGRESDFNLVAAMGVDVNAMAIGTTYPVNWKADWVVTGKKNQKGTAYYRDVTSIRSA